jgi:hypothetical protein
VELLGETPNGLSASKTLRESHLLVYYTLVCQASSCTVWQTDSTILSMKLTANANRQFHFDECRWLFIRAPFCTGSRDQTHRELVYRRFQFQKRS